MDSDVRKLSYAAKAQHPALRTASQPIVTFQRLVAKYRTHFHFAAVLAAIIFARPTDLTDALGLVPVIAGLALRTWALGHLRRNTELCTSGPYAYVRHPLYLGSFVILMGYFIMTNNLCLVAAAAIVTAGIYGIAIKMEEESLAVVFPEQYETYRQAVPLLMPRLTAYGLSSQKFSWQLALNNKVVAMWVLVLVVAALFEVKEDILEYLFGIEYSIIWPLWHGLH